MRRPELMVWCPVCRRYITRETGHGCTLAPTLRRRRNEARRVAETERTAA